MNPIRSLTVSAASRSYPVRIGNGLLETIGQRLSSDYDFSARVALVADARLSFYAEAVLASLSEAGFDPVVLWVPSGESSKSLEQLGRLLEAMAEHRIDRQGAVLALGGGVVGDLAGLAASIFLRGIALFHLPTTVLSMVDSAIGGKTGVNLPQGKNLVGTFYQPWEVFADLRTLATLPEREIRAGLAEVIKYGMIVDPSLLARLEESPLDWQELVGRSAEIKAAVIREDERETRGRRAILNFGHTAGHALEAALAYETLVHGEAVALGMRVAVRLSQRICGLPESAGALLDRLLLRHGLPRILPGVSRVRIREALQADKKRERGINHWVLLRALGDPLVCRVPEEEVERALGLILDPPE
ncbi:3-dehydroquinate synthase [Methylacidimicrobium sp. AP8]|uniref:3-dehydroquinate synthase n=1 Tax=Methylacidimicrobium sp. AP8 TaxID=2730359 RepID=UPI0018C0E72C|nr:3-dehydroquinate synthase [Methylacidimicrobium sp. AP8]CAB4243278.1 3-dehydroquinate synthase [Methylacidimicrobium sp. AP8]